MLNTDELFDTTDSSSSLFSCPPRLHASPFYPSPSPIPPFFLSTLFHFPASASPELTFWFYVKEHLNRHELQRFYSLRHISSELGRGRAWLRCALNEHSLERYLHMLLADRQRLGSVKSAGRTRKQTVFVFCLF